MSRKYSAILIILFMISWKAQAQQVELTNQYLVNPYSLTPTLAGYNGSGHIMMDYRNQWTGMAGNPRTLSMNGAGNIYQDKMWLGAGVVSDQTDLFSILRLQASYSYQLQVNDDQSLFFGTWITYYQSFVNLSNAVGVDPNDPLFTNPDLLKSSAWNAGFGLNYNRQDFNLGIAIPALFGRGDTQANATYTYRVQREVMFYASNLFSVGESWDLQATAFFRKTITEPGVVELSTLMIYNQRVWGGALYRTSGAVALTVGARIGRGFVINYSYDIGTSGIYQGAGGTHEVVIGFKFLSDNNQLFGRGEQERKTKHRGQRNKKPKKIRGNDYRGVAYPQLNH